MEYNNKNFINNNDDLSFVPLNVKQELNPINSSFPLLMNLNNLTTPPSPITNLQQGNSVPIMVYPTDVPDMYLYNNINSTKETNLQYPDQVSSDDLYSYNESRYDNNYIYNCINPIDILRNFDLNIDEYDTRANVSDNSIDNIFTSIEKNNPGILGTMKAYRIPYPIAKLIIKKIIFLTLKYEKGR